MSTSQRALAAYRHGLRATKIAFKDDLRMLTAARQQMRAGMHNPPDPKLSTTEQIKHLEDVALFLRRNVVQGKPTAQKNTYHLNIHKDTELGDNDSIKSPSKLGSGPVQCCGGAGSK